MDQLMLALTEQNKHHLSYTRQGHFIFAHSVTWLSVTVAWFAFQVPEEPVHVYLFDHR